ncbi:5-(carboxyamino)imidazole ribonucleotide synthase [Williamsia sp. R60]
MPAVPTASDSAVPPAPASPEASRDAAAPGMPVVTMIGGGQLARMTHQAAIALGQRLRVLAASADEPAAQVSPDVVFGSHNSLDDLRAAARGSHALTFDHEHVPIEHLEVLVGEGVSVLPPPSALIFAQDKLAMRRRLADFGAPIPAYAELPQDNPMEALIEFGEQHHWQVVLKTIRGGYDGRGVWLVDSREEALEALAAAPAGSSLMVEQRIALRRELSAMVGRSPFGQGAVWPVVETVQRKGQCAVVIAPAPNLSEETAISAQRLALSLAGELGVVGVMAVELFETTDGSLLVNELAMRPHNSGHWSMDGSVTGQFEQHLRAVLDYPLGDTGTRAPVTVMANILGAAQAPAMSMDERLHHLFARIPQAKVHLYGKGERPDRKIGHVNVLGSAGGNVDDPEHVAHVREIAERAAHWMSHAEWTDGWDVHGE